MHDKNGISLWKALIMMLVTAILGGVISAAIFLYTDFGSRLADGNVAPPPATAVVPDVASLPDISQVSVAVAAKVSPSIVSITSKSSYRVPFLGREEVGVSSGSGVIYSADGYIITNNHVVSGASSLVVGLADGNSYPAKVIGTDVRTDLAVIKIEATGLPAAEFGDSDKLLVGEWAMAIGNPGGDDFVRSVTQGGISGVDRVLTSEDGLQYKLIQTDAAINPGNSGGALVNSRGQVIGINSIKLVIQGYEGMGFAIPSNLVLEICSQLKTAGMVTRPGLGVAILANVTPEMAEYNQLTVQSGVLVEPIVGGAAEKAGLKQYDIITALNGQKINNYTELQNYVFAQKIGDVVKVTVQREKEVLEIPITLAQLSGQ